MWTVELESEVGQWMDRLSATEFAATLPHVERPAERGNQLRMPASRSLGDGLFELRFVKNRRLDTMTPEERAAFDQTSDATRLALEVGEKVRDAREAAGLSQRDLAARMGTSQAAVARLEAGGVGATLTTLQKVAAALDLKITVDLSAASSPLRRAPRSPRARGREDGP